MIFVRIDLMVLKLVFFVVKDILLEEEFFYDYLGRFFNLMDSKNKERLGNGKLRKFCYCGVKSCVVFLFYDSLLYCFLEKLNVS